MVTPEPKQPPQPLLIFSFISRFRILFLIAGVVFLLAAFNGRWRIGRDSAAYRALGHHLATTGRYNFRDVGQILPDQESIRYPGLPILLAGIEKVAGRSDAAPLIVILAVALASLVLAYRLGARLGAAERWLPIAVLFGLAINQEFLQHAQEILTDIPFLFCVLAALCVYPLAISWKSWKGAIAPIALLCIALVAGASLRPTFWIVALAIVATLALDAIAPRRPAPASAAASAGPQPTPPITNAAPPSDSPSRRRSLVILGILLAASLAFWLLDIRSKKHSALGGYEQRVLNRLPGYFQPRKLFDNAHEAFENALPECFFATQFGPGIRIGGYEWGLSTLLALVLAFSPLVLWRQGRLYAILPIVTFIALVFLGAVSRYFIMILPLLLISWGRLIGAVARRIGRPVIANLFVMGALGLVVVPNLLRSAVTCLEQHGMTSPWQKKKGLVPIQRVGFLNAYAGGSWRDVYTVAAMIRDNTGPRDRIIGPEATVLSYLSDRNVFGLAKFVPIRDRRNIWASTIRDLKFRYAVFPPSRARRHLYQDKDFVTGWLISRRFLRPGQIVDSRSGYALGTIEFSIPHRRQTPPRRGTGTRRLNPAPTSPTRPSSRPTAPAPATRPAGPE